MIDNLHTLRGRDYTVAKGIVIRQPTIGEIEEYDEMKYMSMISTFTTSPFDMIAQLDKVGIDFTAITSYQLFCMLCTNLKVEDTKILFGDLDFSKFRQVIKNNRVILAWQDIEINEVTYNKMAEYIRKINMLAPPQYNKVANEYTKQKMIEYAYDDLEFAKRRKPKSMLKIFVSRATNHPYFKYKLDEVWNLKVYAFYDALTSINIIESSNHLYMGAYSGNLDLSKINKKEFNWLREAD